MLGRRLRVLDFSKIVKQVHDPRYNILATKWESEGREISSATILDADLLSCECKVIRCCCAGVCSC